jgi:SAM-dependent methyltransferase
MEQKCEVCQELLTGPILNLGKHPLCDDLYLSDHEDIVPAYLQLIQLCTTCLTAHQLEPVTKEKLFKPDYHYRAGLTRDVLQGMEDLTKKVTGLLASIDSKIVLDIGCNDGSLLGYFKKQMPNSVTIGVDPTNAILEGGKKIDHVYHSFFNEEIALAILEEQGAPDVITFTNVFAHIEDLPSLLKALKILLHSNSILVIENHYLGAILERNQFDTFYHEHPRTYSATTFSYIAESLGMQISSIEFPHRYGGNIRVILSSKEKPKLQIESALVSREEKFIKDFEGLQVTYDLWKSKSALMIEELKKRGGVYGKSLPGRAVMLISSLGIDSEFMPGVYEQDHSPKVGYLVPGTKIKILPDSQMLKQKPEVIIVWAWHIIEEICKYLEESGFRGEVWVPLPTFKLYKKI